MAHWAEIDKNNLVVRVVVTSNKDEDEGHKWLIDNLDGDWVQTSFNTYGGKHYTPTGKLSKDQSKALRYNFAAKGFRYDPNRDAFISPQPSPECTLDEKTCLWVCPDPEIADNAAAE